MKKVLLLLGFVLGFAFSYSQEDCSQGDGTFRYRVQLNFENLPADFDKNDFLTFITGLDNISNQDLATLTNEITTVFKTIPTLYSHKTVDIIATMEIYSILTSLKKSVEFHYCVNTDCSLSDGTFSYYAALTSGPVATDFDKNDFINYITGLDNISKNDLNFLNQHIISVYKAFPSAPWDYINRIVTVDATADIYFILEDLNNSIEFHECQGEAVLGIYNFQKKNYSIIYPNPITEYSVLKLNSSSDNIKIELINSLGQIIYSERATGQNTIAINSLPVVNGISFIKIYDLNNGNIEVLKILKLK